MEKSAVPPANPPIPNNARLWSKPVSPDMTAWAKSLLNDPFDYPMFSQTVRLFGSSLVLARVEWHNWTFRNGRKIEGTFRGITLYELSDPGAATPASLVEGIDVSHYQGVIDWKKVASAGKAFAFIKATDGGAVDAKFAVNWQAAANAGILRGAYHFFHPAVDALAQAELFLSKVGKGELPPVLDVEPANITSADAPAIAASVHTWVEHVASNYGRPLIYTSPSIWQQLPNVGSEASADLWVAHWDVPAPTVIGAWPGWSFWQYGKSAAVGGVSTVVDLDRFNGSLDDLHAYVTRSGSGDAPSPPPFDLNTTEGVQRALNFLGASPALVVDGILGPKTRAAVQAFQRANRLAADGVVGPRTIACLSAALTLPASTDPSH
jgi:lysozyme